MLCKKYIFISLLCCSLFLSVTGSAQNSKGTVKIIEYIRGEWRLQRVYDGNKVITDSATLGNRRISFNSEAKFERTGDEPGTVTRGPFRVNEDHGILYLETIPGRAPEEWNVSFSKGNMLLQQKDVPRYKYLYKRVKSV